MDTLINAVILNWTTKGLDVNFNFINIATGSRHWGLWVHREREFTQDFHHDDRVCLRGRWVPDASNSHRNVYFATNVVEPLQTLTNRDVPVS